ncbi:hypothetical protein AB0G02_19805 [Actinosynnema sp. NPDC023658]|uniref:hypothetical protein n=1 Tax=Actinosynnema sp. NPDC023658 TaxID=3155465 RepID=UPI0033D9F284
MAVLLVVAACGTQDPTATPSAPVAGTTSTPAQRPVFDPARTFSSEGVRLPPAVTSDVRDSTSKTVAAPHVLLRGRTAWAATSDALLAFDAESGETRAEIRPERASTEVVSDGTRTDLEPPRVVAVSGRALVVQTFAVTVEGRGTTAARAAIEVVAADADAAGLAWRQVVDVPAGF